MLSKTDLLRDTYEINITLISVFILECFSKNYVSYCHGLYELWRHEALPTPSTGSSLSVPFPLRTLSLAMYRESRSWYLCNHNSFYCNTLGSRQHIGRYKVVEKQFFIFSRIRSCKYVYNGVEYDSSRTVATFWCQNQVTIVKIKTPVWRDGKANKRVSGNRSLCIRIGTKRPNFR